ncbi:hypothetical protein [Thiomicrorhabdus sp.]|uniref:hypothetical protein n=1 Tax=Thiomicrorhabdus sp. TaxID=2039724 RepID=UPI002AA94350|nr:hypothetical protein [Thiomicrorhabdus sp.]
MANIHFSTDLFDQIGGTNWITRPGKFEKESLENMVNDLNNRQLQDKTEEIDSAVKYEEQNLHTDIPINDSSEILSENEDALLISKSVLPIMPIVVIGAGLESIWQNEESLAWQLWQNIMKAFEWDEAHVVFFDTELIVTEDAIFSTMEEVIELGVEWVLSMDEEHEISEQLSEGVQVVSVPVFELMLSDPYAKQSFYHSIIALKQYV